MLDHLRHQLDLEIKKQAQLAAQHQGIADSLTRLRDEGFTTLAKVITQSPAVKQISLYEGGNERWVKIRISLDSDREEMGDVVAEICKPLNITPTKKWQGGPTFKAEYLGIGLRFELAGYRYTIASAED